MLESDIAMTLGQGPQTLLACTAHVRLWAEELAAPGTALHRPLLAVPHAVLCSEMGAHFSPCGRLLALCVACQAPAGEDGGGAWEAEVAYELRIYSLEGRLFGQVLCARAVAAAHCLTSIQFSPTSQHLLLAYGRRHLSLLRSLVADASSVRAMHTVVEVYRAADLQLVRVLASVEDEVNVACWNPTAGLGMVYGTKEGRLRLLLPGAAGLPDADRAQASLKTER